MNQTLHTPSQTRYRIWWWMIPLLLLTTLLGSSSLNADTIWYDEYWSLYYAGSMPHYGPGSLPDTWTRVASTFHELNPPGYYLLLHIWGQLVGWTPFVARGLSLLIGLLAVAWIYRLARDLSTPLAGIGAAVALALSAFFISFTYELRAYLLFPLFTIMALWAYWGLAWGPPRPRSSRQILFVLSLTALLYTHYTGIPVILATALYHLIFAPKGRNWWRVVLLVILSGILFLPWAATAYGALQQVSGDPARETFALAILPLLRETLSNFSNQGIALLAVFAWYALRANRRSLRFVSFILVMTTVIALSINEVVQFITEVRYMFILWPLLALIVGLGATVMVRRRLQPVVLLVIWAIAGIALVLDPEYAVESQFNWPNSLNWDILAERLQPLILPADDVIYYLPRPVPHWIIAPVAAYYLYELPAVVEPFPFLAHPPNLLPGKEPMHLHLIESLVDKPPADYEQEAAQLLQGKSHIWIAYDPSLSLSVFIQPAFDSALADNGFELCNPLYAKPDLFLGLYARSEDLPPAYHFGDGINVGLTEPLMDKADDKISFLLNWQLQEDVPLNTYSFAISVDDQAGNTLTHRDFGIPGRYDACQVAYVPLEALPAGTYDVSLLVYNWQTGERLSGGKIGTDALSETQSIGEITID